jgi:hypothetical protein
MNFRPRLVGLEDRCLLTTVTNLMDSGPGSLRQAIIDTPAGGTVDFQDGLSGTITLTSAPLTINKILTIEGPGASVITVSGNHARQVFVIPSPFTVAMSGLTIANGNAGNAGNGSGISNGGALTITNCTLSGNSAANDASHGGGGIFNTGTLTVTSTTLSGNQVGQGGGIYNNTGTLMVTSSTFSGNSAYYNGGGIYNRSGTAVVTNSTFSNNSASNNGGGGLYTETSGTLQVTNSTHSGNSASYGGGISIYNGGTLNITSSTFSGISTASTGGGISTASNGGTGSNVTIANSTFNLNAAATGAGISHTSGGTVTVTNSTLSGNFASSQGGGIFHSGSGMLKIGNTIVAMNNAPASSVDVMGSLNSQSNNPPAGYNLIGNGTGGTGYCDTDLVGTADMPIDPLLGPLQDNGGPTFTMALLPGSPALNAGDPDQLGMSDQRGVTRSGGVNIGAYQASATTVVVTAVDTVQAGVPFDVTVTAVDPFAEVAIGYTGTVTFSSADPYGATLPADYTFTAADQGTVTFAAGATLYTVGAWDVTATDTDSGIAGSATVTITPAPAVAFQVIAPVSATSGLPFDVTLVAADPYGNTDTNSTGTVTFSTSDPDSGVVLPPDYTFQPSDQGMVTFPGGVTLITVGDQSLTATDTVSGITGTATVTVTSGTVPGASHFGLDAAAFLPPLALAFPTSGPAAASQLSHEDHARPASPSVAVTDTEAVHFGVPFRVATDNWAERIDRVLSDAANPLLTSPLVDSLALKWGS